MASATTVPNIIAKATTARNIISKQFLQKLRTCTTFRWPCGPMDKASVYGTGDSRFESWQGHLLLRQCVTLALAMPRIWGKHVAAAVNFDCYIHRFAQTP